MQWRVRRLRFSGLESRRAITGDVIDVIEAFEPLRLRCRSQSHSPTTPMCHNRVASEHICT